MSAKTEIVPIGEYRITDGIHKELLTVVGSCVALVLYDSESRLSGMLHAVLPGSRKHYRKGDRNPWFADTGTHLLIQEMTGRGAGKKNLRAVLAGGAEMLTDQMPSDIGRRNTESVLENLRQEGIPIVRQECGGKQARRIRVCEVGRISIGDIPNLLGEMEIIPESEDELSAPYPNLPELLGQINGLRASPTFARNLMDMLHQPLEKINWEKVFLMLSRDMPLSLRFFRLVNSPYFGRPRAVSSFKSARKHMGEVQLRRICLLTVLGGKEESADNIRRIADSGLSRHCLAAAITARHLARRHSAGFSEQAYTAALLHGTGALPLLFKQEYGKNFPLHTDYGKTGGLILSEFGLPTAICTAVISHEYPENRPVLSLNAYVHMGCVISRMLGYTSPGEPPAFLLSPEIVKQISPEEKMSDIVGEILEEMKKEGLAAYFSLGNEGNP